MNSNLQNILSLFNNIPQNAPEYAQIQNVFVDIGAVEHGFSEWFILLDNSEVGWIDDMEFSLEKDPNCLLKINETIVPLLSVFFYLSGYQQKLFWLNVCQLMGRTHETLKMQRDKILMSVLSDFKSDLHTIGINKSEEEIVKLVQNSRKAINGRSKFTLPEEIEIHEHNMNAFWGHMQKTWNALYPYDKIFYKVTEGADKFNQLINMVSNKVANIPTDAAKPNSLPDMSKLMVSIFDADFFQTIGNLAANADETTVTSLTDTLLAKF